MDTQDKYILGFFTSVLTMMFVAASLALGYLIYYSSEDKPAALFQTGELVKHIPSNRIGQVYDVTCYSGSKTCFYKVRLDGDYYPIFATPETMERF